MEAIRIADVGSMKGAYAGDLHHHRVERPEVIAPVGNTSVLKLSQNIDSDSARYPFEDVASIRYRRHPQFAYELDQLNKRWHENPVTRQLLDEMRLAADKTGLPVHVWYAKIEGPNQTLTNHVDMAFTFTVKGDARQRVGIAISDAANHILRNRGQSQQGTEGLRALWDAHQWFVRGRALGSEQVDGEYQRFVRNYHSFDLPRAPVSAVHHNVALMTQLDGTLNWDAVKSKHKLAFDRNAESGVRTVLGQLFSQDASAQYALADLVFYGKHPVTVRFESLGESAPAARVVVARGADQANFSNYTGVSSELILNRDLLNANLENPDPLPQSVVEDLKWALMDAYQLSFGQLKQHRAGLFVR